MTQETANDIQGCCEVVTGDHHCGKDAVLRYPAMGGGWMRLCAEHGEPHRRYCEIWFDGGWQFNEAIDGWMRGPR